jgi:hypothetical protein
VLAAGGAGLAALAGCSVDLDVGEGGDEREYDAGALRDVVEGREVPTRPDAFPVRVPEAMLDRHYGRARQLVAAVPERPDVPNGAVAERLRERRARVVRDVAERPDAPTGPDRLAAARRVRGAAAEVNGAYRAAVGELDRALVAGNREALREDVHGFRGGWDYRGGDPARALVVHAELEGLLRTARRRVEAWPPFPEDPRDDVFRAGEVLGDLSEGWTAFADAGRLRTRYLADVPEPVSYRPAITAAAHRIDRRASMERRRLHDYTERPAPEAFELTVEGTPAGYLYERARRGAENAAEDADAARRAGERARATLEGARALASVRAFRAAIDAVEAGEYGPPEDAGPVAAAREVAVAALREAWTTEPVPVSVETVEPARETLSSGYFRLEGADGQAFEADDALADFAYARLYAEAVPDAVSAVLDALQGDG